MRLTHSIIILCWIVGLSMAGCRKDSSPAPSRIDENYFVITDNPNDPVDHAIYEFYKTTGIASFMNDTIYKKQTGHIDGQQRGSYIKLSLSYTMYAQTTASYTKVSSKERIPALLELLKEKMLPKLPSQMLIPSILLADSVTDGYPIFEPAFAYGWTVLRGFNTVGISVKDVEAMSDEEKAMYTASMLAGIAEYVLNNQYADQVQNNFFGISRTAAKTVVPSVPVDIYTLQDLFPYVLPPNKAPLPQNLGFLRYPMKRYPGGNPFLIAPREADDCRAFLTAAFFYAPAAFADLHVNETLVLKKFSVIRELLKQAGFQLPD
ncbi:hypothetical protein [Pseudobacter ginsenosidimutans]|uniref:Lipoprotein n=1 Tax=Pseudobacter ginsenosidimutans TaxID=661488 RepID=A0A4Q7N2U1_9BACT|nr:hypothetical protein [Pseudobacter ginsenosidimutans]QEC42968.1 hypothetical protein FSB84_15190 [Pseudobacter ginsenosidimutans]RZS74318.1 hypothetical protein EV199_0162 [Pseudobacter ginsenosidimutans]